MKKQIIQIVSAFILFIIALCAKFENIWINRAIYLIGYLIVGGEIILKAIKNIFKGELFDEHFLMAVATIGAIAIGEYPEAVAVMLFYQVGELFQDYAVDKSKKSITELMNIRPDYANVKRNENITKVNKNWRNNSCKTRRKNTTRWNCIRRKIYDRYIKFNRRIFTKKCRKK